VSVSALSAGNPSQTAWHSNRFHSSSKLKMLKNLPQIEMDAIDLSQYCRNTPYSAHLKSFNELVEISWATRKLCQQSPTRFNVVQVNCVYLEVVCERAEHAADPTIRSVIQCNTIRRPRCLSILGVAYSN